MYKFKIRKIMHKISNNLSSHISKLLVITDKIYSCNMRHYTKKKYLLPCAHTSQTPKSLYYYDAKLWNEIPKPIKENSRKNYIKINLLSQNAEAH